MADEQTISVQKEGVVKRIPASKWKELWPVAQQKGYSRVGGSDKGTTMGGESGGDTSGHAGRGGFSGTMPPKQDQQSQEYRPISSLVTGLGHGVNPTHGAPEGTPSSGGMGWDAGADMFNMREAKQLFESGDKNKKMEGIGLSIGTGVGFGASEVLKGVGAGMKEAKLGAAAKRMIGEKAVDLVKSIRGTIKDSRLGEELVQRHRDVLNGMYKTFHAAQEKEIVPLSNAAQKMLLRMEQHLPKTLQKDVAHLFGRSALDYKEAFEEVSKLRHLEGQSSILGKFADELDKELDKVAAKNGLSTERGQLKGWYKRLNEISSAGAQSIEKSALRSALRSVSKVGKFVPAGEGRVGEHEVKQADALWKELTGKAKNDILTKIGKVTEFTAKKYKQTTLGYRALHSALNSMGPETPTAEK
jgi:hypothetical protein